MPHKARTILDALGDDALGRLLEKRDLSRGGSADERRTLLARRFRGDIAALLEDLRREDLIRALGRGFRNEEGERFVFTGLSRASGKELRKLAEKLFLRDWSPDVAGEPVLRGSRIAVSIEPGDRRRRWQRLAAEEVGEEEGDASALAVRFRSEAHARELWSALSFCGSRGQLRPYQAEAVTAIEQRLSPKRPILLHVATGGGKTFIANEIVVRHLERTGGSVLWVTKDWRLLYQAVRDLCRRHEGFAQRVGRLGGDAKILAPLEESARKDVVCTTLNSLERRFAALAKGASPRLVVWDECHWAERSPLGRDLLRWARQKHLPVLGLTATPRAEGSSRFEVAFRKPFAELVREGYLARPIVHAPLSTEVRWSARSAGRDLDFTGDSLAELASSRARNRFIVEHYRRGGFGKTIVFACTVWHAERLAKLFREAGVAARAMHCHLDDRINEHHLEQFRRDRVQVIVNVAMLTHGVDVPDARTVFLCRPTMSPILYAQMVGRGARLDEASGKRAFDLVDFVDLSELRDRLITGERFFAQERLGDGG